MPPSRSIEGNHLVAQLKGKKQNYGMFGRVCVGYKSDDVFPSTSSLTSNFGGSWQNSGMLQIYEQEV